MERLDHVVFMQVSPCVIAVRRLSRRCCPPPETVFQRRFPCRKAYRAAFRLLRKRPVHGIFVVVQLFLRERRERLATLLQFPLSLVFSRLLNLCSACIPYQAAAHSLPENLAVLALAIVLTGVGVALTVNMRLVPNPGDGIVQAVAQRMGRDQGFAKNVFDLGCVAATVCLGLLLTGRIVGIGLGTLLAMVGVGRVIALVNHWTKAGMSRLAGVA